MCGRYSLTTPLEAMRQVFGFDGGTNLAPRYNIAPTQTAPVIRADESSASGRVLAEARWGLIPSWAKDGAIGNRMINARAETVADKPSFRSAYRHRRCLVPADGFYEWQKLPTGGKQPYRIAAEDETPFTFAGLFERWVDPEGDIVESFTILTTEANALLGPIHSRMPVILEGDARTRWLAAGEDDVSDLLVPHSGEGFRAYAVGRHVNSPKNDDPDCFRPLAAPEPPGREPRLI